MVNISQFGSVPGNLQNNANFTVNLVNEIFAAFPAGYFRFTSGYRTPQRNAAINGNPNSFHLQALAADFVPVNGRFPYADAEKIGQIVSKYGWQVVKHDAGSGLHYHIEPASRNFSVNQVSSSSQNNSLYMIAGAFLLLILLRD